MVRGKVLQVTLEPEVQDELKKVFKCIDGVQVDTYSL